MPSTPTIPSFVKTETIVTEERSLISHNDLKEPELVTPQRDMKPVIVETGPVHDQPEAAGYEDEGDYEEETANEHISASQLFGCGQYEDREYDSMLKDV